MSSGNSESKESKKTTGKTTENKTNTDNPEEDEEEYDAEEDEASVDDMDVDDAEDNEEGRSFVEEAEEEVFSLLPSEDRHIQHVNKYVGRNLASFGYTSLGGDRMDRAGAATIKFVIVTPDGSYVDPMDEEGLKQYVVKAQNVEPNTEINIGYMLDSDGEEYDNLTNFVSCDVIDLSVLKIGDETEPAKLTEIKTAPDRYTYYIRDYTGKNLASFGYTSLGGDRMDSYGNGYIKLTLVPDDGSFIDPEDQEAIKQYVVTGQDLEPNSELKFEYMKDNEGEEYDNLISNQSYDTITLYVKKLETE